MRLTHENEWESMDANRNFFGCILKHRRSICVSNVCSFNMYVHTMHTYNLKLNCRRLLVGTLFHILVNIYIRTHSK